MQRQSSRWYAFEVAPEYAGNMSVVIMARAVSGQITMALWGPGSDPYQSVPTQVGTNYMDWPGLKEVDQDEGAAGGGHASLASEQQYLFLSHRSGRPLLVGQYVVVVQADMGQPLVSLEVSTPSSMTQLVPEEQEALKQLVADCCPGLGAPGSSEALAAAAAAAAGLGSVSSWCNSMGRRATYDLRQWYSDICHIAPNVCSKDGHLQRLVLPPYALRCNAFPQVLARFPALRHLDMSYSVAPGSLADVSGVLSRLPELRQLHLRGIGLTGPLSCDLMETGEQLRVLSLSDNDKLSGSLPPCWLSNDHLQELQLAGLSDLTGPLPDSSSSSSSSDGGDGQQSLCGFGRLKYVNMAGVIGDAGVGLTGTLPAALGFCKDLLYLDLSGHSLTGPLPALPPGIQLLNVSSNALSGPLPEFAVDAQLQYLDLSFNRFTGTLQDMTLLQALDWLDLSDNALTGPMPPLPPSVRWVDLSNNQLTGGVKLPAALSQSQEGLALVLLNVAGNELSGPLPADLARLPNLAFLDLSHNQLTGSLAAFGAALRPSNNLLQVNLAYNRLSGDVPASLQQLAAVRPVRVTMKDGYTPITRIFDISNNDLSGTFPAWLVVNVPQLVSSCQCSVGVNLDGSKFSCPTLLPRITRQAQAILHSFESLTCTSDDTRLHGLDGRQLIPIWVAAAGPGQRPLLSRAQHRDGLTWQQVQQRGGGKEGVLVDGGWGARQRRHQRAAAVGLAVGLVVAAAVLAGLAAVAVMRGRRSGWINSGREGAGGSAGGVSGLSVGAGHYTLLPDYSSSHGPGSHSRSSSTSDGGHSHSGTHSPSASSSSSSGLRTARSSCSGDGVCEIALVLRVPGSDMQEAEGQHQQVAAGGGPGVQVTPSSLKLAGKSGEELL